MERRRGGRGKSVLVGILLGALGVAVLAFGTWRAVAAFTLGQVRVGYDLLPIECTGTEVSDTKAVGVGDSEDYLRPVVVMKRGMECRWRLQVVNDSWREIEVSQVALTWFGEGNSLGVTPKFVSPNGGTRLADGDNYTARFAIDGPIPIATGTSVAFTTTFVYDRPAYYSGCGAAGPNGPAVTVSAFGVDRVLNAPERDLIWFFYGTPGDCE